MRASQSGAFSAFDVELDQVGLLIRMCGEDIIQTWRFDKGELARNDAAVVLLARTPDPGANSTGPSF